MLAGGRRHWEKLDLLWKYGKGIVPREGVKGCCPTCSSETGLQLISEVILGLGLGLGLIPVLVFV